jgi:hypothetical protein
MISPSRGELGAVAGAGRRDDDGAPAVEDEVVVLGHRVQAGALAGNLPSTPALMGNTVVWKPSEKSALSSDVVMRAFEEAGLPPGVINLVHGDGRSIADQALASEHLAGVGFTGSTAVFRSLWKTTAQHVDTYRSYPRAGRRDRRQERGHRPPGGRSRGSPGRLGP